MAHLDDVDLGRTIIDRVDDPVRTHAYTEEPVVTRKLLAPLGSRFVPEGSDAPDEPLSILFLADRLKLFRGARLDQDPIACHAASEL